MVRAWPVSVNRWSGEVCERTTCEYFRVASNVVAKGEEKKGGQEVEEIVPRLKVFPEEFFTFVFNSIRALLIEIFNNICEKTEAGTFLNRRRMSVMPPRSWLDVI